MVCRQQLSLDVRLERGGGAPWGFQLVGGAEAASIEPRVPLTVTQVESDTPASRAGLADGDLVVAINGAPAQTLTREAAHEIIVGCKLRIQLAVIRTIGSPEQADISSSDIPFEVPPPPHARSATSSPFMPHIKPFRPFSTEPLDAVPPLERPIILSPFYHDNFTKLKKLEDFETPTKFKLEISKYYVPDDEMSVTESYSKMQMEHLTSMEELSTELDIQQIEDTAAFVVNDSLSKAVSVTESRLENYESKKEINEIIDKADSEKVSVSLLTQLIDQTADEISKSKLNELIEKKETNVEMIENKESVEFTKLESIVTKKNSEFKSEKSCDFRQDVEKHNLEKSENHALKSFDTNESTFIEEESKSAKDIIKSINLKVEENVQDIKISKKNNAERKVAVHTETSESKKEVTQNKQTVESRSLNEVKHQTISTANLLAEQRAYTLGLQTIPNIQGRVQSTYHYDLLLKTFFIHLTDVMVALSRIILSDGASRSVSPMPPQKTEEPKQETQQVTTEKSVREHTTVHKEAVEESQVNNDQKKISAAKFAQIAQFKTDDITQKMDAVISEFKKGEEVQTQDSIEISHKVKGKSVSKIEEQVLQENDPLDWLSKVDENKTFTVEKRESKTSEVDDDLSGKIIYVATVEAHQISNLDTSLVETNIAKKVFAETESVEISTETSEEAIKIEECTSEVIEEKNKSLESLIIEDSIESTIEKSTIQESQVSISEQTQSFAIEESKIESVAETISIEESKLKFIQESSENTTATQETVNILSSNSEAIEVIAAISPQRSRPESRKTSIEDGEPVRKPDLESQSVSSEDSYVPAPQTPLTDEYIFRLQLPLEESKNPLPPSPPVEHEDPYTVKKPKLIPHIETALHTPKLFGDPEKDQTKMFTYPKEQPPNTNGTAFLGNTEKVDDVSNIKDITAKSNNTNADLGTILPRLSKVVDTPGTYVDSSQIAQFRLVTESNAASLASNVETKSLTNIETTTLTHGARRTSTSFVEESLVQISEERNTSKQTVTETQFNISGQKVEAESQQNIASMSNGNERYVKQNCGLVSKDYGVETHHGGLVKKDQAMATVSHLETNQASHVKQNCGLISKDYGTETHHGGLVKKDQAMASIADWNTKQVSHNIKHNFDLVSNTYGVETHHGGLAKKDQVIAPVPNFDAKQASYVKQNCGLISKDYGTETHHGGLVKKDQIMAPIADIEEKQASYIKQNCGLVNKHYGVVTHHGGIVKRIQEGGVGHHGAIVNDIDGTTLGIVDSLDNAGILDEEVAKRLGKPGLTAEKIAELMSGESEMLREAHVIGLKRVLASHMSRSNEDEDSVDFKKLKPQIDALRDSEVLKALNEELTKTKQEQVKEERKWTTFLQRPQRVVPKSKYGYIAEPDMPKELYKINIVKQPKPKVAPDYKPQDFETGPLPWEARAANRPPAPPVPREEPILIPEEGPEYLEALDNLPESEVPDLEDTGIALPPEPIESPQPASPPPSPQEQEQEPTERDCTEAEPAETEANNSEDMERNQLAEKIMGSIQSMVDPCASVEEQLKQMRAQLSALAQLPGVITQTLELVTEQLGQLTEPKDDAKCGVTVTEVPQETPTTDEQRDIETTQESSEPVDADTDPSPPRALERGCDQQVSMSDHQVSLNEQLVSLNEQQVNRSEQLVSLSEQQVSLNEQHVSLSEQHKIDIQKKEVISELQLEHEARQVKQRPPRVANAKPKPAFGPLTPQERPLVLPGGRRWRNAKDAYNEDFIRETLASQAEIIQGKAKGVNFMKWEKPAKTLDHLKDSDVYKLIHNMDTQTGKQVDHLPPKVMAESEYREQSRMREILEDNGVSVAPQSRPASASSQELIPQVLGRCSPVCAAQCLRAFFTECPQACGGVLPDVCASKCQKDGVRITQNGVGVTFKQNGGMTATKQDGARMRDDGDSSPIVTELIVPPAPPRVELPPRPSSVAEAVEIVTNYVEIYENKSRTTPAA